MGFRGFCRRKNSGKERKKNDERELVDDETVPGLRVTCVPAGAAGASAPLASQSYGLLLRLHREIAHVIVCGWCTRLESWRRGLICGARRTTRVQLGFTCQAMGGLG